MSRERKSRLVEDDMTRDDDTVGGEVETPVAFVIGGVADEDTQSGAWGKFVGGGGSEVGIAGAPKNSKFMVGGWSTMECEEGSSHVEGLGGKTVKNICGSGKSVGPVGGGHGRLEE